MHQTSQPSKTTSRPAGISPRDPLQAAAIAAAMTDRRQFRRRVPSASCSLGVQHEIGKVKPIEDIQIGDVVWAWDVDGGIAIKRHVKRLFRHKDRLTLSVVCVDQARAMQTLSATIEHPFWVARKGWVAAQDLMPGDALRCIPGDEPETQRVLRVEAPYGKSDVFNFEVDGAHNYFVGPRGVLVHNSSDMPADLRTHVLPVSPTIFIPEAASDSLHTPTIEFFSLHQQYLKTPPIDLSKVASGPFDGAARNLVYHLDRWPGRIVRVSKVAYQGPLPSVAIKANVEMAATLGRVAMLGLRVVGVDGIAPVIPLPHQRARFQIGGEMQLLGATMEYLPESFNIAKHVEHPILWPQYSLDGSPWEVIAEEYKAAISDKTLDAYDKSIYLQGQHGFTIDDEQFMCKRCDGDLTLIDPDGILPMVNSHMPSMDQRSRSLFIERNIMRNHIADLLGKSRVPVPTMSSLSGIPYRPWW